MQFVLSRRDKRGHQGEVPHVRQIDASGEGVGVQHGSHDFIVAPAYFAQRGVKPNLAKVLHIVGENILHADGNLQVCVGGRSDE